jgi:hypothetical protein
VADKLESKVLQPRGRAQQIPSSPDHHHVWNFHTLLLSDSSEIRTKNTTNSKYREGKKTKRERKLVRKKQRRRERDI